MTHIRSSTHAGSVASPDLDVGLQWWAQQVQECPACGGPGVRLVVEVTDQDTASALQNGLACLGDCCIDGLAPDRECRRCGHRF